MPPSKPNDDRVTELAAALPALKVSLEAMQKETERNRVHSEAVQRELQECRVKLSGIEKQSPDPEALTKIREQLAVLKQQVEDLRKSGDENGRRIWGLIQLLIGAAVGGVITYLVKR
jgi:chromosome segregation ATPase